MENISSWYVFKCYIRYVGGLDKTLTCTKYNAQLERIKLDLMWCLEWRYESINIYHYVDLKSFIKQFTWHAILIWGMYQIFFLKCFVFWYFKDNTEDMLWNLEVLAYANYKFWFDNTRKLIKVKTGSMSCQLKTHYMI